MSDRGRLPTSLRPSASGPFAKVRSGSPTRGQLRNHRERPGSWSVAGRNHEIPTRSETFLCFLNTKRCGLQLLWAARYVCGTQMERRCGSNASHAIETELEIAALNGEKNRTQFPGTKFGIESESIAVSHGCFSWLSFGKRNSVPKQEKTKISRSNDSKSMENQHQIILPRTSETKTRSQEHARRESFDGGTRNRPPENSRLRSLQSQSGSFSESGTEKHSIDSARRSLSDLQSVSSSVNEKKVSAAKERRAKRPDILMEDSRATPPHPKDAAEVRNRSSLSEKRVSFSGNELPAARPRSSTRSDILTEDSAHAQAANTPPSDRKPPHPDPKRSPALSSADARRPAAPSAADAARAPPSPPGSELVDGLLSTVAQTLQNTLFQPAAEPAYVLRSGTARQEGLYLL